MSVLDRTVLERLRKTVGDDAFVDLIGEFLRDSVRLRSELLTAVEVSDVTMARRRGHELRGLAALFGAKALQGGCSIITDAVDTTVLGHATRAADLCSQARDAMERFLNESHAGAA
jgi:HPt (histidine-containing phosphotransfer) domain-containing protein